MGTYLSTPVVEKGQESGEALDCPAAPLAWGVVDMQGWRKSMEDSHVAQTDIIVPPHLQTDQDHYAKVFGVFDGHGGAEVARFVQLYLVDVLTKQPTWLNEMQSSDDPLASPVGQALIDAFHALDRMIDQPERREELIRLRSQKPEPGERRTTDGTTPVPPSEGDAAHSAAAPPPAVEDSTPEQHSTEDPQKDSIEMKDMSSPVKELEAPSTTESMETNDTASTGELESPTENGHVEQVKKMESEEEPQDKQSESNDGGVPTMTSSPKEQESSAPNTETSDAEKQDKPAVNAGQASVKEESENGSTEDKVTPDDDDSDDAVGKEEAAELDRDMMLDESDSADEEINDTDGSNRKVTTMFQKFLALSGNAGDKDSSDTSRAGSGAASATNAPTIVPTIVHNGRQICNLPDHPIHAGCTAVVAVLIGRKLTIANAGDSRAVLCRGGGRTEALSFDHKPQQHRELDRITKAGGFVNQFGRVNGNLNLSRSIGDLKYKQVPGIHPAGQMITAEPDIVEVFLQDEDEFLIIGCDGIWDCLSNAQAVNYVRTRIDHMTPTEIGVQMLDEIISDDPRASQGIGGDNMTIMIIDLQPEKRSYRKASE